MFKHYLLFLCSLCVIVGITFAQSPIAPASLVKDSKTSGFTFKAVEIFQVENSRSIDYPIVDRMLKEGTILVLDPATLGQFKQDAPATMTLRLPSTSRATDLEVELVEVNPFAEDFKLTTDRNPEGVYFDRGKHYRGVVKGVEGSIAAISFLQGEVMGMIALPEEGNFVLGKVEHATNNEESIHVLYRDDQMRVVNDFHCETPDDGYVYTEEEINYRRTDSRALSDCVRFYFETEVDMFQNKGSVQAVGDYVTGIYNQVGTIYSNENINTVVSEILVWTGTDPYTSTSSSGSLSQFQGVRGSGFNGDLGQLLTFRNVGGGIAAGFDGICNSNPEESLSFSAINTTYADYPAYSWTVMVVTHEFGHTFGSRHTHACVWNGNGTAIDGCAGFTEGSCPIPGNPSGGGTIMSYCHQTSVGINPALGFGSQPGNVIRNEVDNGNCLQPCSNPNAPDAPSSLNANTVSDSQINIDWNDNSNNEDGFIIERSTGGSFSQIATVGANTTSYSDNGLNQLTTYTYRVAAYNNDGNSSYSNSASATTSSSGGGGPCAGCVDFSTTNTISYSNQDASANVTVLDNGATLGMFDNTWRRTTATFDVTANTVIEFEFMSNSQGEIHGIGFDNDDNLSSNLIFQVYGTQNWGNRDFDYTSIGNFQSFSIPVGTFYTGNNLYLVLVNDNDAGSGNNSYFRNVRIYEDGSGPTIPDAPSGLSATANSSSQIDIDWNDNANDEDDFVIERSSGGGFSQIAVVGANSTSYTDNGLSASTTYTYRVAARNSAGTSSWSNQASATTDPGGGGGCTTVTIEDNDFESGWGMWNDGGSDSRRGSNYLPEFVNSGSYSVRLRDNTSQSVMTTDNLNLSSFEEITVDFTYITNSFDNSNEDFWLQISTNGGGSYNTVEEWNLNDEFVNNVREFDAVTITSGSVGGFSSNTRLRIRCDASANGDQVYIDDVVVTGCSNASTGLGSAPIVSSNNNKTFDNSLDDLEDLTAVKVYPNPAKDILWIENLPEGAEAKLFDTRGRVIEHIVHGEDEISLNSLSKGIYILQLSSDEIVKTIKVVKE